MKRFFPQFLTSSFTTRNKMKRSLSRLSRRSPLALVLISFVAAATLITFVVSANRNTKRAEAPQAISAVSKSNRKPLTRIANRKTLTPVAPFFAPIITATLSDGINLPATKNPGDTINYTAVITNTGTDASNVIYTDILDSNTTLVGGSVKSTPIAFDDAYNVIGNVRIQPNAAAGLLVNDIDPDTGNNTGLTTTAQTISSGQCAGCNNVTIGTNGDFSYNPPVGFQGTDTFTYTVNDPTLKTGTGTVTLTVSGMIWFINNNATPCTTLTLASGCGRLTSPFSTLAAFQGFNNNAGINPKINDNIFIFESATSYNATVILLSGQKLFGQDSTATLQTLTGLNPQAYSDPFPTMNTGGNATTLISGGVTLTLNGATTNNNLNGFTVGASTTTGIAGTNFGTVNVGNVILNTGSGQALVLNTGTLGIPANYPGFTSTTSTGGTNNVSLTTIGGTVNLGSGALSGAGGNALDVNGGAAAINFSGTISNSGARQVSIVSKTSGTVALSGAVSGTGTGIFLNANGTSTINFTGGVVLSTGTNDAFTATSSGTTTVTGAANTLTTTTGQALKVTSTTIAATGLTFATISSSGGANNGITLDTTGANAGLTVTGTGGVCTTGTPTCTGGTIVNKTGGDGSLTSGIGIYLNSTINPSFTRMSIQGHQNHGIRGGNVTGFTLDNSLVGTSGINGTSNTADVDATGFGGENSIRFFNLLGSATISNSTIDQGFSKTIGVANNSGTLNRLTITNCTVRESLATATASDSLFMASTGAAIVNFTINGASQFSATRQFHLDTSATGTSTMDIIINGGNAFSNSIAPVGAGGGMNIQGGGTDSLTTFNIDGNSFRQGNAGNPPTLTVGRLMTAGMVSGAGKFDGKFTNNTVGVTGVNFSGGGNGADGIGIFHQGNKAATTRGTGTLDSRFLIQNNTFRHYGQTGVQISSVQGNGILDATVIGNTMTEPGSAAGGAFAAIWVNAGALPADTSRVDVVIGSQSVAANKNTMVDSDPNNFSDVFLDKNSCAGCASTLNLYRNGSGAAAGQSEAIDAQIITDDNNGGLNFLAGWTNGSGPTIGTPAGLPPVPPIANFVPDEGAPNPGSMENQVSSNTTLGNGGSSLSPTMFDRLKQVLHPVAAFATDLNFLRSSEVPVTAALTSAEKSAMIAEVKGISAPQKPDDQKVTPQSGETITVNGSGGGFTLPAGKSITITYDATVNSPPFSKTVSTQGHVFFTGGPGGGVPTDDPDPSAPGASDPTVTNINTTSTWNGSTDTNWNNMLNWTPNTYAPGVTNPAVNDVVIPSVGAQPNIGTTDIGIFSLNIANGRTLTITSPRILTIGGAPGGNLTLDGIISGGELRFGTGTHTITNAGGTGSFSSTNLTQVLSGSTVTLNNNLQMGSLNINAGGLMDITGKVLSLNGPGTALTVAGTLTTVANGDEANPGAPPGDGLLAGNSTVVYDGSVAQTGPGLAYFSLTINNPAGVTFTGNASTNAAGTLALTSGDLNMGTFTMSQPLGSITSGGGDVVGNLTRTNGGVQFPSLTNITFGNPNTLLNFTAAGTRPMSINFRLTKTVPTDAATGGTNTGFPGAVQRTWLITPTGGSGFSATMQLHYLTSELNGNVETNTGPGPTVSLRLYKYVIASPGTGWQQQDFANNFANTTIDTSVAGSHFVKLVGVTSFSPWTIGGVSTTAATSTVSGRITDDAGNPVEGAVIRLNGTQDRKTITDAAGNYNFAEVETNGFYTVTPSRVNYDFAPSTRGFSALGAHTEASFAGAFNGNHLNPLDTTEYFVRQQYVDFLGREPEEKGFNDWTDTINNCAPGDASCDRVHVSEAFFRSEEFQQRGYFVYRFYSTAFGQKPDYAGFVPDLSRVSGFLDATQLEAAKTQFASDFTNRAAFVNQYGQMSNAQYVDALAQTAGVTLSNRQALVDSLEAGTLTRGAALRQIAESGEVYAKYYNQAFVVMEYFGYLRRDPDALYLTWISVLDANPADSRRMVEGFVDATEYRNRFKQ